MFYLNCYIVWLYEPSKYCTKLSKESLYQIACLGLFNWMLSKMYLRHHTNELQHWKVIFGSNRNHEDNNKDQKTISKQKENNHFYSGDIKTKPQNNFNVVINSNGNGKKHDDNNDNNDKISNKEKTKK